MTTDSDKSPWFRAKRYGLGWGLPLTWQGWTVFATYFSLLAFGIFNMYHPIVAIPFSHFLVVITAALVAVCYMKGEKARWRWGK